MGWKGTLRSISAASRAAERDYQRQRKQELKAQVASDAAESVEEWETHIRDLVSIHTDLADAIDWLKISGLPRPTEPTPSRTYQECAREELTKFKPGLLDFIHGGTNNRRMRLEAKISAAEEKDRKIHSKSMTQYITAISDWRTDTNMACRLLTGEPAAFKEVINEMQSLSNEGLIGTNVSFKFDDNFVHAIPEVHSDEIVPNFRRKQLASGKLSETKMPAGEFNELYQDYVASVALKVAGEIFHVLLLDEIFVTCQSQMLNSQTGHLEITPILSVQFVRNTFMGLNLVSIDPSDSMKNFLHEMNFKRSKGFAPTSPLRPVD